MTRRPGIGCNQHFHVMCPEVAPITGGVLSSSHDYKRHLKLARSLEVAFGHPIVPSRHASAIIAALAREGKADVAAALQNMPSVAHSASFSEADHQRLKRAGLDLPRLRNMISDALASSASQQEFEKRLATFGLRLRAGEKKDTSVIETADGRTFVGSLARLTRLRKAALSERMKFDATGQSAPAADYPSGDIQAAQASRAADGASLSAGAGPGRGGPAKSDGHHDRSVTADGRRNRTDTGQRRGMRSRFKTENSR